MNNNCHSTTGLNVKDGNTSSVIEVTVPDQPDRLNTGKYSNSDHTPLKHKSTVPCPFLLHRGRCIKGIKCDFSHSNLERKGTCLKGSKCDFFHKSNHFQQRHHLKQYQNLSFFRTTAKYQVVTRTCGVRPTETQCSRNQISTNSHFNRFESIPIDGDVSKSTAITTTHVQPTDGNASKPTAIATTHVPLTSPIPLRITQRTNRIKSYEKPPIRSSNRCNLIHICNTHEKLPNSNLPSILMANVRSLLPKVDELDTIAQLNSPKSSITETWLTNAIPDRAVNVPNFILMRKDRSHCNKGIGGGICAYVSSICPPEWHQIGWLLSKPEVTVVAQNWVQNGSDVIWVVTRQNGSDVIWVVTRQNGSDVVAQNWVVTKQNGSDVIFFMKRHV